LSKDTNKIKKQGKSSALKGHGDALNDVSMETSQMHTYYIFQKYSSQFLDHNRKQYMLNKDYNFSCIIFELLLKTEERSMRHKTL